MHGLRICPDLDSVMYTLGDGIDVERGWGRADETWRVKDELAAYGAEPTWFGLGDLDIATHLVRTRMLDAGYSLTDVTAALCTRWQPGVRLLPMTDSALRDARRSIERRRRAAGRVHFEEWWVRYRAARAGAGVRPGRRRRRQARPGRASSAITEADVVLLAPEQPGRVASARSWVWRASARP